MQADEKLGRARCDNIQSDRKLADVVAGKSGIRDYASTRVIIRDLAATTADRAKILRKYATEITTEIEAVLEGYCASKVVRSTCCESSTSGHSLAGVASYKCCGIAGIGDGS